MTKTNKKVIIAMSGGVDSSVAAKIINEQYEDTLAVFLYFWKDNASTKNLTEVQNKCCSDDSLMDARVICDKIGINLYTMNFAEIFKDKIVDNFLSEYSIGNTPNPCILCNRFVKLGLLIRRASELGYDYVATGHYVITKKIDGLMKMYRAKDVNKDQSYFLHQLTQKQLQHLIFPLGESTKPEVRKKAKKYGFSVASKNDSQEICFVPGKSHNDFLRKHLNLKKGRIHNTEGEDLGEHGGLPLYTIGQRRGVEIGGTGPYYVTKLDYQNNILIVSNDRDDDELYKKKFLVKNVNWISGTEPSFPLNIDIVIRYGHKQIHGTVTKFKNDIYLVELSEKQRAVTPGQSAVFYNGDEVVGGGMIKYCD